MGATAIDRQGAASVCDVYVHESGAPGAPALCSSTAADRAQRCGATTWIGWQASSTAWRRTSRFGRSNRLAPISLEQTADLVAELIAARVPARRAHVVGLSYGGSVVFALLDRHPRSSTA